MFPLLWVTAALAIGNGWPEEDMVGADEAFSWLTAHKRRPAWVVVRDEDTAREVLTRVGMAAAQIEECISFATVGTRLAH